MEDEESQRFIDLATRPLAGDPAAQDGAAAELWGRMAHGGAAAGDDGPAKAAARLEACAPSRTKARVIVVMILLLALAAWLGLMLRPGVNDYRTLGIFHGFPVGDGAQQGTYFESQAQGQWQTPPPVRYPAWEDPEKWLAQIEPLVAEHPDDPGVYHEFVCRYLTVRRTLPPDYRATWNRIDPGNALWPMLECSAIGRDAIGRGPGASGYITVAPIAMEHAINAFRQAAGMNHYRDHGERLGYRQLAAFPPPRSLADARIRWMYGGFPLGIYNFNHGGEATLRVKLRELADAGDDAGFESLLADWKALVRMCIADLESDDSGLGDRARDMTWTARDLAWIYGRRGDHAKERTFHELEGFFQNLSLSYSLREAQPGAARALPSSLSFFPGARSLPLEMSPDLFESRRMAEYAAGNRFVALIGSTIAWLGLACLAIAAFRPREETGKLGDGVEPLFRTVDRAWVVGLGLFLPLALCLAVIRFTPWNGGEPVLRNPIHAWLFQVGALYLMVATALLQAARWRWAKRAGFLALRPRFLAAGWLMPVLALAVFLAAGIMHHISPRLLIKGTNIHTLWGVTGIPLLWLLWHAAVLMFAPRSGALGPLLVARSLIRPWVAVLVLLLGTAVWMQQRESYWMAQDWKHEIDVSRADASRFSGEVAKEIRETVNGLLDK